MIKKFKKQINETRSWFFEKINNIDRTLARLIKKKREKTQTNKITNERETVTPLEFQQLQENMKTCVNKMDNLEERDKFLETCNITKNETGRNRKFE